MTVPAAAQDSATLTGLEAKIAAAVTEHMRTHRIPGLSLAVGARGRVVLARAFGTADLEHGVPVTPETLFQLQSTQKPLTATAILRLIEAGRVGLADPVQAYCPAFGIRRWPVTVRDLLIHRGGVRPSDLGDLFNRDHYASVEAALRRFVRDSLQYQPGSRSVYSNAGYTVLACVIEGAMGQTYDVALERLVLRPAGMRAVRADNVFEIISDRTRYYLVRTTRNTAEWAGLWTPAHLAATALDRPANADPVDPSWAYGAGNYLGTATDMTRFGLALLEGRLLGSPYRDSALVEVADRRTLGGWLLGDDNPGTAQVLGSSWNGSFGLAVDPSRGLVVAIASNIEFDQPADLVARILNLWNGSPD